MESVICFSIVKLEDPLFFVSFRVSHGVSGRYSFDFLSEVERFER